MDLQSLVVPLLLNLDQYNKGIEQAKTKANNLTNGLSAIGGGIVSAGIGAAVTGLTGLGIFLGQSTKAAQEAEEIQAQLNAVLKSTGGISGMTSDSVNELANNYGLLTKFEDDAIVSGENMLLTFTNIGSDVFPETTKTMLDMSQALGQDLTSSAMQLGKALNDPTNGMTALQRVGVTFNEQQKEQIKVMQEAGDIAGAQKVILNELQKEFGGSAEAAGKTFAGQLEILKNKFGNIQETVGGSLLPVLTKFAQQLSTWLSNPQVQIWITDFTTGIANLATQAISYIPVIVSTFQNIVIWLQNNQPVVVGILGALGVAVAVFAYSSAVALWAMMSPLLPIIAVMIAIGVVVGLLYSAWQNNFLGIRDTLTKVWNENLKPIFELVKNWLQVNIPIALKFLSDIWNNVLLPAIKAVWGFLSTYIFPLFQAIASFVGAVFSKEFQVFSAIFTMYVIPALKSMYSWLADNVFPIIKKVAEWVGQKLSPAFDNLKGVLKSVTDWFKNLATSINNLKLPSWLTPGSPFPFTYALMGLNDELKKSANQVLPAFSAQLNIGGNMPTMPSVNGKSTGNSDIVKAIQGMSNEPIDYQKLGNVIAQQMAKLVG